MPAAECPWWCAYDNVCGDGDHTAPIEVGGRWSPIVPANATKPNWRIGFAPASGANIADVSVEISDADGAPDREPDFEIAAFLTADQALHMAYKILDARYAAMHSLGDPSGHLTTPDDGGEHGPIAETEAQVLGLLSLLVETRGIAVTQSSTEAPA